MATIEKRVSKNGETSYRIRVSRGYTIDKKQIVESFTYKPDKGMSERQAMKEAQRQAILYEEQHKNESAANRRVKFRDLAEEWVNLTEETREIKISSVERLKGCRERTYDALGDIEIDKITYQLIQRFIVSLSRPGVNQRTGQGLSEKSQKHYLNFISNVMRYAIRCDLIINNPCKNVSVVKTEKREKDIYSLEELKLILAKINERAPTHYKLYFSIIAYLGLRKGEALGLEFGDFDLEHSTVSITRTSNYRNSTTGIYESTPKTKRSCRILSLPDTLKGLVRQLKSEQEQQRRDCGDQWQDTDRLFIKWNGEPMHPNTPYTWLERFCKANDLAFKGLHSFRHTFATQAITSGTDIATVSSVLGHSLTSTTLNQYTHAVQAANVKAINVIADLLDD